MTLIDLEQARQELGGISTPTIYRLIRRGDLPFVKVGGRTFFRPTDIDAFVDRNWQRREFEPENSCPAA